LGLIIQSDRGETFMEKETGTGGCRSQALVKGSCLMLCEHQPEINACLGLLKEALATHLQGEMSGARNQRAAGVFGQRFAPLPHADQPGYLLLWKNRRIRIGVSSLRTRQ
jgi:hypothetical protein